MCEKKIANKIISDKYLELLKIPLDDQQLDVCRTMKNAVVAAGAGSGKTEVLATRFAYLVMSHGIKVDEILTLTFTDKAAAEMYERIYARLAFFASNENVDAVARERAQNALKHFSDAHIQTLDSYCAAIVRQGANRYGVRPDFSVGTGDAEKTIRDAALPFVLARRNDAAIVALSEPGKLQDVANYFFADTVSRYTSLASGNNFFTDNLPKQCEKIAYAWNKYVSSMTEGSVQNLVEQIILLYGQLDDKNLSDKFLQTLSPLIPIDNIDRENYLPEFFTITKEQIADGSFVEHIKNFLNWFCQFENLKFTSGAKTGIVKEIKDLAKNIRDEVLPFVLSIADYIVNYKTIETLAAMLDEFLAEVNEAKRQTGKLTFYDVTQLALLILRNESDIRKQEYLSYKKIMIDEFQDNNKDNRDMLFLISENENGELDAEKLFFVGDEKQSIYKFRGADVATFNRLKKDLGEDSVKNMVYNYRSSSVLLAAFNQFFGGYSGGVKIPNAICDSEPVRCIFPENAQYDYEAAFGERTCAQKFEAGKRKELDTITEENVPLHVCMFDKASVAENKDDYLEADEQIACFIAEKIKSLVEGDSAICYRDVAILDRSRTHRKSITRALSRLAIPYTVDQHKNLFGEALANDIYYFLRLCIYPSDVNAFAVFLRSPFAALSESSVETILALSLFPDASSDETPKANQFVSFDSSIEDKVKQFISAEQFEKYVAACARYNELKVFALSSKITDTLYKIWYEYGYRYEYMWSGTGELVASQFDLLYEIARTTDESGKSVAWFVDELGNKKNSSASFFGDDSDIETEDVSFPVEDSDAVNIMTIHKSKGLQFPYVFILGCTDKLKSEHDGKNIFYSDEYGVAIKLGGSGNENYFFAEQKEESNKKSLAEFRRLVYVAVTRAKREVYMLGSWDTASKAERSVVEKIIESYYFEKLHDSDGEAIFEEGSPFDFTNIMPMRKAEYFENSGNAEKKEAAAQKAELINRVAKVYKEIAVEDLPCVPLNKFFPSSFERYDAEVGADGESVATSRSASASTSASASESLSASAPFYPEIENIVSLKKGGFNYAKFGTLAHAYLEAAVNDFLGSYTPPDSLFGDVEMSGRNTLDKICREMADKFLQSESGADLTAGKKNWYKTEYRFKSKIASYIISGSIDLLYKTDDSAVIVDYKTDREILPERYTNQLYCYRQAAAAICKIPPEKIRCVLYYLRHDKACEVTESVAKIRDEDIAELIRN